MAEVANPGWGYFEHEADIGVIGRGPTLAAALEQAAAATFAIMADPVQVEQRIQVDFEFTETDPDYALVTLLNRLLAEARLQHAVFSRFQVRQDGERWQVEAGGELWRSDLARGTEVKGATLTMLAVQRVHGGWEARCVVDV